MDIILQGGVVFSMLDVTLAGCGGTIPLKNRWLTSCMMRYNGKCLLIDCGEGTQIAMKEASLPFKPLGVICLTHYHADHISGLPGLLLSMGGEGRTDPVVIIGPGNVQRYISSLLIIAPELPFEVVCVPINEKNETFAFDGFNITAFHVNHTMTCYGYTVEIPRAGKFDPERARRNGVPLRVWNKLQKNQTVEHEGIIYTQDMAMGPPRRGIKVTYCTDTRPVPVISAQASGCDLFICEGMYGDEDKAGRARESRHMTFSEAASLAAAAPIKPRRMWLTHYSPSMPDPEAYIDEARAIFPDAVCGRDGMSETIRFDNE